MADFYAYSPAAYAGMIADDIRREAFAEALRKAVTPDSVVLDIGTGTGYFALLACRFGARRVIAVEPNPAVHIVRQHARENGFADRIEVVHGFSTDLELSERADVIISDLRGILPLFEQHLPSIIDARQRLLAEDGVLIPQRDTVYAALVEAPDIFARHTAGLEGDPYGVTLSEARRLALHTWRKASFERDALITEPAHWVTLDYRTVTEINVQGDLAWTVEAPRTGHGVCAWFDSEKAEGVSFSNAPGEPEAIYGRAFFPWLEPVALEAGDTVRVLLRADLVGNDYIWSWHTRIASAQGTPKAEFRQSTFHGMGLTPAGLRKRAEGHRPSLTPEGATVRFVLGQMEGNQSLADLAAAVTDAFPERYPTAEAAFALVRGLSEQYSR